MRMGADWDRRQQKPPFRHSQGHAEETSRPGPLRGGDGSFLTPPRMRHVPVRYSADENAAVRRCLRQVDNGLTAIDANAYSAIFADSSTSPKLVFPALCVFALRCVAEGSCVAVGRRIRPQSWFARPPGSAAWFARLIHMDGDQMGGGGGRYSQIPIAERDRPLHLCALTAIGCHRRGYEYMKDALKDAKQLKVAYEEVRETPHSAPHVLVCANGGGEPTPFPSPECRHPSPEALAAPREVRETTNSWNWGSCSCLWSWFPTCVN